MASNGTNWRIVPTGYSTFGMLSLKMRIASASCWGSACLMRVFRTWGQSRMHPKVCSDTETSAGDATDTIQRANPTTSRLRLNIGLPFSGRWLPWFDVDVIARPQPRLLLRRADRLGRDRSSPHGAPLERRFEGRRVDPAPRRQ